ncbi:MAG: hypothetical protein J0I14_05790 [Propionibacteriaceae bacterium]|jgi:DNA-binding transcriptional regulator LsrR (DeoR family)|nr:hypothetical protein [Propionibacteriaceae bacterium]
MSTSKGTERVRARQMLEIARRYYLDGESMVSISSQLGVSRFKVARLLNEARETGLVTITLNTGGAEDAELSARLAEHFGLRGALVVEAFGTVEEVRHTVGAAAGRYLVGTLTPGETLGLTWGRTLTHMIESLDYLPDCQVLQLTGTVGSNLRESPIELVRRASLIGGRNARALMAPLYIDNPQAAQALREQPDIKEVLDLFATVTTAVVAVGSLQPNPDGVTNSQFLPLLPPAVRERMLNSGAVAEVCGLLFRPDGTPADPHLADHVMAIRPEQLRKIPRVIGLASDASKAEAILALWRADLISELVVDADLAETLLAAPTITRDGTIG